MDLMTDTAYTLKFDPFDNPMQLKKVGNWVFTFLNGTENNLEERVQLAITHVIPRQMDNSLQLRRLFIEETEREDHWRVQVIECFDSANQKEVLLQTNDEQTTKMIQQVLQEFSKYDVIVELLTDTIT